MPSNNKTIYDPVEVDADYFAENESEGENFYSYVKTLPVGIINILFGVDTPDILEKISASYGLSPIQSASLSRLIRKVLIGEIYIRDFPAQISSALNMEQSRAKELGDTVATELFQPELEDIKKVQMLKFPSRGLQNPTPPPSQTVQKAPAPVSSPPSPTIAPRSTTPQPKIIPPPPRSQSFLNHDDLSAGRQVGENLPETHGNIIDLRSK